MARRVIVKEREKKRRESKIALKHTAQRPVGSFNKVEGSDSTLNFFLVAEEGRKGDDEEAGWGIDEGTEVGNRWGDGDGLVGCQPGEGVRERHMLNEVCEREKRRGTNKRSQPCFQ